MCCNTLVNTSCCQIMTSSSLWGSQLVQYCFDFVKILGLETQDTVNNLGPRNARHGLCPCAVHTYTGGTVLSKTEGNISMTASIHHLQQPTLPPSFWSAPWSKLTFSQCHVMPHSAASSIKLCWYLGDLSCKLDTSCDDSCV